jgi:2-amino-4-hydroxy-6-hydroxymethyldihydropteridine diphosphokinase
MVTSNTPAPNVAALTAYVGLGSNIGERESFLLQAIAWMDAHSSIKVMKCSSMYETAPVGFLEQPSFLNMVIKVSTLLTPEQMLSALMKAENVLGRTRSIRWGPRTIDLDLLLHGQSIVISPELTIPHPRMLERAFVMIPLNDVIGDERIPGFGCISQALEKLDGKDEVKLWKKINWRSESGLFVN